MQFIEGKMLLSKFGLPGTQIPRKFYFGVELPYEFQYSVKYNSCFMQRRGWSVREGVCIIEYQDGGKSCNIGKDCFSGTCLLDQSVFDQWIDLIYSQKDIDPNKSVSPGDKIDYPQLPDTIQGTCASNNLCNYGGGVIRVDKGVRHAIGSPCGQL